MRGERLRGEKMDGEEERMTKRWGGGKTDKEKDRKIERRTDRWKEGQISGE